MVAYVGFCAEDQARLRRAWSWVEPHAAEVSDAFYDRILAFPEAAAVFEDLAQVNRLKATLQVWLRELHLGPWDHDYHRRRTAIGRRHVRVGLAHRYMFTAMSVVRDHLCSLAMANVADRGEAHAVCLAIQRVTQIDLAAMTQSYMEMREAESLDSLQTLLVTNLPVTVLLVTQAGLIRSATRPGRRLLGGVDVEGAHYLRALPQPLVEAAALGDQVAHALETGLLVSLPRVDVVLDGRERSFSLQIVPLNHALAAFLLHVEELTATVEQEVRLRRAEALAKIGALSAAVAHELRNPLAGISGAIQVISRSMGDDDRRRGIMDRVLEQIRRLDRLVGDLLAFSRQAPAHLEPMDLRAKVDEVVRLVTDAHPDAVVDVTGEGEALADPDLLHRVVLNLVTNALQALDGDGRVEVRVDGPLVVVDDDGPGIPEEHLEQVFEPFFTTKTQGTGLGLAICRNAATAMGGDLLPTDSRLGGACLRLRLRAPRDASA